MYYGVLLRHLLLTPITKYKYTVQDTFDKCLTKKSLIHVLWRFCETLVANTYY